MIVSEPSRPVGFAPFSITLTFENQEEVNDLYNRVVLDRYAIKEVSSVQIYRRVNLDAPFNTKLFEMMKQFV